VVGNLAHEAILDNGYIYGIPFHSYEKTFVPNTGVQELYNVQNISCSQFVNRFTDYDFSGGALVIKISFSDGTEATRGFGQAENNYIFYAVNHGAITGVRVYSDTARLTDDVYVKGIVLFGKEGNDLKSVLNTVNKNISGIQTKLYKTGISRSDVTKDFTDFCESWDIDISITAPHRIAYCQTVFKLTSEKITGINSIRVKGTIIPITNNINNIRLFDADQFSNYTYSGNYVDIPVDGITTFDEVVSLTGLESATINVGLSVGNSEITAYHTNWQYLLHGLEVYVNGQRIYGNDLTFHGMIGFDPNTYTLENKKVFNKAIATLPIKREDISAAIKDQSYLNISAAVTQPDRVAYLQNLFSLTVPQYESIEKIRVKGIFKPKTDNINVVRFYHADQMNTTAGLTSTGKFLPTGEYAEMTINTLTETEIDETIYPTGLTDNIVSIVFAVGKNERTSYNTNWTWDFDKLQIFVNDELLPIDALAFRGYLGFDGYTPSITPHNIPDILTSDVLPNNLATLPIKREDISDAIKDQSYINIQAAITEPERVEYLQNVFSLTVPQYEPIEKIRVKGIFVPKTENINIVRFYQADQMNTTAGIASAGKFLPTGEYAEIKVNTLQETEIDETIYPSGLSDNIESVVFAVARSEWTAYNTAWTWDFNNLQIFINDKLLPIDSIVFKGYIGFDSYTPDIERINVPDIVTSDVLKDYIPKFIPKFAGVPAPNVLPIGKNFATGTLAVERSADTSAFDASLCESPVVWWDSNKLKYGMVYTGYSIGAGGSPYGVGQVGLAWSDDLEHWEKDENAPILSPSHVEGDPDRGSITGPVMLLKDGVYYLYYIGCSEEGYERGTKTLCLATGTDIYNLTKFEHNPIIAPQPTDTTSPYRHNIYHANIVFGTDKYYMFINCSGVRPTDQHACENILLFTSDDLYNWAFDSVVLEGGTATTDPDYSICGDPCVFDIGDDNLYMTIFRVTLNSVGTGTGLARTSKKEFPYGWKKYDFRFGSGIKAYVTFKGNTMYHFYNENDNQIYVQTSN